MFCDFARVLVTVRRRDQKLGGNPGQLRNFTLRWSELFGKKGHTHTNTHTYTHFAVSDRWMMDQGTKPSSLHTLSWELAVSRLVL